MMNSSSSFSSSSSMWNWIAATAFIPTQQELTHAPSTTSASIVHSKKTPTPPLPSLTQHALQQQQHRQKQHHHQRSAVVAANTTQHQQQQQQPVNESEASSPAPAPAPPAAIDWRSQMEMIVKLSIEMKQTNATADPSQSSATPKWCVAVAQALKLLQNPPAQGAGGSDCRSLRIATETKFWEIAADEGNLVAGIEFARLVLSNYLEEEKSESADDEQDTQMSRVVEVVGEDEVNAEPEREDARIGKALRFLDLGCSSSIQMPSAMHLVSKLLRRRAPCARQQQSAANALPPANAQLSRKWLEKAASMDYAPAIHELGELFFFAHHQHHDGNRVTDDDGVEQPQQPQQQLQLQEDQHLLYPYNVVGAMRCFKKAADLGFFESCLSLGKLFLFSLLDDDSNEQQKEKIMRAQHFLNQYLQHKQQEQQNPNVEVVRYLEKCSLKLVELSR